MNFDEAELMAFVDGELDAETASRIAMSLATDSALRVAVERHRRLRVAARSAFGDVLAEPIPDALIAAVRRGRTTARVVDFAAARAAKGEAQARRPSPARLWQAGAIAAALVIGVAGGRVLMPGSSTNTPQAGLLAIAPGMAEALNVERPGARDGVTRTGFSFRDHQGEYCRTFQTGRDPPISGIACRDAKGWSVRVAAQSASPGSQTFRMAASDTPPAVLAAVDAMIEGPALDAEAEAIARADHWRPRR